MKEYLFLIRGGDSTRIQQSPEEMQEHMHKWGTWMKGLASEEKLVGGLPLDNGGKVVRKAGDLITDGPFAEGKEVVGGYLIVKADSIDGAVEISKGCPVFEFDGIVEVRELLSMDM